MGLDKIAVTLYDVFGYLLPGYVVLLALSIAEATFAGTWFISLSLFGSHPVPFAVAAYFAGQLTHGCASALTEASRLRRFIQVPRARLEGVLLNAVRVELKAAYGAAIDNLNVTDNLSLFLLADAYVVASGAGAERDLLTAREGFFKQSVVAFAILTFVMFACVLAGGASIQTHPGLIVRVSGWLTAAACVLLLATALVFRLRFGFYHRIKINNTMLLLLAIRARERGQGEK